MYQSSPRIYRIIFFLCYCLYWLASKINSIIEKIIRIISSINYRSSKIQQKIRSLHKTPSQVILTIQLSNQMDNSKGRKIIIDHIIQFVDIISQANVSELTLFFWGKLHNVISQKQIVDCTVYSSKPMNIKIIKFDQFYEKINPSVIQWNKQSVPLLISMSSYNSFNCIPFTTLIDAEFVFCPPISQCLSLDILKSFEQYASSKQRHGK